MGSEFPTVVSDRLAKASNLSDVVNVQTARGNIGAGNVYRPADHGFIAWAYDVTLSGINSSLINVGVINTVRLKLDTAASITNVCLLVSNVGVTLTSGQCFAGLYQNGSLLGSTADQSGSWVSTGAKIMQLVNGPFPATAGDVLVAFYYNGTTSPGFGRTSSSNVPINFNLAAANSRHGTAGTATTALPPSLPTLGASASNIWAAVS